jgi:hypothetical protein
MAQNGWPGCGMYSDLVLRLLCRKLACCRFALFSVIWSNIKIAE